MAMPATAFNPAALTAARTVKGLSRHQLSQLAGVSHQTIARLERGEFEPRGRTFAALVDALGLSPLDLYTEDVAA